MLQILLNIDRYLVIVNRKYKVLVIYIDKWLNGYRYYFK